MPNPTLNAKVTKKLKTLTFEYDGDKCVLDIVDGEINLIDFDDWITGILRKEWKKMQPKILT